MDMTALMISMLFGTFGFGFFLYGKKTGQILILSIGMALMICPYFIPNITILLIVCIALTATPYLLRHA